MFVRVFTVLVNARMSTVLFLGLENIYTKNRTSWR